MKNGDSHLKRKFNLKRLKKTKSLYQQLISYGGFGIEGSASMQFWPLFIFFLLGTYQKIGLAMSLGLILTVVVTYSVGKRSDKRDKCHYIRIGSFLTGTITICKVLAQNIFNVVGFNLLNSVSHSIYLSPYVAEYYSHADEESRSEYIFLMESIIDAFRILYFAIMYILGFFLFGKDLIVAGLILGGVGTYFTALMPKTNCEIKNQKIKVLTKIN